MMLLTLLKSLTASPKLTMPAIEINIKTEGSTLFNAEATKLDIPKNPERVATAKLETICATKNRSAATLKAM